MNYESVLYIDVAASEDASEVCSVRARGRLIREPRVGNTITIVGLPCDPNYVLPPLEMDLIEESLAQDFIFVRCATICVANTKLLVEPDVLADEIEEYLSSVGWTLCDDDGNPL
jgi:hypothetical protein